jgi:hypothetical protein
MLQVVANALRSPSKRFILDGYYRNEQEQWGYYLVVWDAGHYHMISVSRATETPAPRDIAAALDCPSAQVHTDGRYRNRRGTLGYYATVKSGDHWYMVSVSDLLQPFHGQWWADRHAG